MCKFSMVTRSQQQAAWPGLRNSGTNTRKQAACSGSYAGQWSLAYPSPPAEAHSCSTCAPASPLQGHQEQGWWYPLCFRTSEYCADTLCYQINRLPSEASASTHVFFFFKCLLPLSNEGVCSLCSKAGGPFLSTANWRAYSLHSVIGSTTLSF